MIVYRTENGMTVYETRSDAPNTDFSGGKADFVIDELDASNAQLISDIQLLAPFIVYVIDDKLKLIGVNDDAEARAKWEKEHPEPAPEPEPDPGPASDAVTWDELAAAYTEGVNSIDK